MEGATNITNISQVIIDTINNLLGTLFSSIDNSVYDILDKLTFIDMDILDYSFLGKLFNQNSTNGLLVIANSLLLAVCVYYCFKLLYAHFTGIQIERPYQFVFKLLIFGIFINCSLFIVEFFIYFPTLIDATIRQIGEMILGQEISFSTLINNLNSVITVDANSINVFSFEGIIKSLTSVSFISLIFSYSLRYVMIKVFILLTPFALISLINTSTSWFFKSWLKIFLSLLFMQIFISLILIIALSLDFASNEIISKILIIGSLYALIKANYFVQQFVGGISTDVSQNLRFLRSRNSI